MDELRMERIGNGVVCIVAILIFLSVVLLTISFNWMMVDHIQTIDEWSMLGAISFWILADIILSVIILYILGALLEEYA